jgi:hypothetical protein
MSALGRLACVKGPFRSGSWKEAVLGHAIADKENIGGTVLQADSDEDFVVAT